METDTANRYRSRILREMNANRENPFNSPPSSTGSHRAASPTLSSVFSDPEGESTRRLNQDIARVTAPRKLAINWEAAHRKWPEFYSNPNKNERPIFDDITGTQALNARTAAAAAAAAAPPPPKEKKISVHKSAPLLTKYLDDETTQDAWNGSKRTRAEMQARVENESDLSLILAKSPAKSLSVYGANKYTQAQPPGSLAQNYHNEQQMEAPRQREREREKQASSLSEVLERYRREPSSPKSSNLPSHDTSSPNMSSAKSSLTAVPTSPSSGSPGQDASHVRSFFMPDVTHLEDFVTGTLRFTGSVENGVPILVKHGKVHDQKVKPFAARHAEVDGVAIPEGEEKIFVSMDMIREEIISLQDHHDKIQEYAVHLQREVERLETQRNSIKTFDGRLATDRPTEQLLTQKKELEAQVALLQARLDQANQKVSSNAIESDTLIQERDRAIHRLQEACEDINKLTRKLSIKEKELETTSKQLGSSEQTRQENDTLRRDLASIRKSRESMELENASLRTDNEKLRQEVKHLREESESLRSDNKNLRGDHQSLLIENRSLRTANKAFMMDDDDFRDNVDGIQHELDAAREEIENLQQELRSIGQEKSSLREDNDSLVRHNEKYFKENKILRRENSGFERSIHDLHDQVLKLNGEVKFLKGQLDHCRPIPKAAGLINDQVDEDETEENMTSTFFVPDITVNTDDNTETNNVDAAQAKDAASIANEKSRESRSAPSKRDSAASNEKSQTRSHSKTRVKVVLPKQSSHAQKVAFSLPEKSMQSNKAYSTQANKGSKRKTSTTKSTLTDVAALDQNDDTTGLLSVDDATMDQSVSMNLTFRSIKETGELKPAVTAEAANQPQKLHGASAQPQSKPAMPSKKEAINSFSKGSCPALSNKARRVLDSLCGHNCQNCIVCSRITSHNGLAPSNDMAVGKRRVTVPRPVPVSERQIAGDDHTVRPAQSPGHALALVIKGLEDESHHLQLELMRLQMQYNGADKSHSRRQRLAQAEAIKMVLKHLEVKNDQIYGLYDVLEGQKAVDQAMSEEEIELTVLNITGLTVRDVTCGTEHTPWEGIMTH